MNSPWLPRACSHAARSVDGGVAKVPPAVEGGTDVTAGEEDEEEDGERGGAAAGRRPGEHAASSYTPSAAATPPADRRNRRRSMPLRRAASSTSASMARRAQASPATGGAGTNSPLDTGPGGMGRGSGNDADHRRRRGERTASDCKSPGRGRRPGGLNGPGTRAGDRRPRSAGEEVDPVSGRRARPGGGRSGARARPAGPRYGAGAGARWPRARRRGHREA